MSQAAPAARSRSRPIITGGIGDEVEAEYASDDWDARRLGVAVRRGRERAHFGVIHQRWLREPIKRWARFRLSTGYAFTTVDTSAQALARFSLFLEQRHPEVDAITAWAR